MGRAKERFGDAEDEVAVRGEFNERLDRHAVAVETGACEAKPGEGIWVHHEAIMQPAAARGEPPVRDMQADYEGSGARQRLARGQ
jgi:hypothetical protein